MALLARVYFNAVFGALGGLLGWMLFGTFGDKSSADTAQAVLGGAFIGGFIGYFVVSVEAIRDRSAVRFCRLAAYGVVLGAIGGALGMWLGEAVHYYLVRGLLGWQEGAAAALRVVGEVLSRALGWMFLGAAVGFSEGIAARSLGKLSYGTLGGALGGFVGGALFGLFKTLEKGSVSTAHVWVGAIGLAILGACIGALSALVQAVFQPASVKVLRGWQEGREYPLAKTDNLLGRDEIADIALFRDKCVEKRHAIIRRDGNRYVLCNHAAPPEHTRVNDEPVAEVRGLKDGDRIQLGNIVLRFQMRSAKSDRRSGIAAPEGGKIAAPGAAQRHPGNRARI